MGTVQGASFTFANNVDFSRTVEVAAAIAAREPVAPPHVLAVQLGFTTLVGQPVCLAISPGDAEELLDHLEVLVPELGYREAGLPIQPELWNLHPIVEDVEEETWDDDDPRWDERWTTYL